MAVKAKRNANGRGRSRTSAYYDVARYNAEDSIGYSVAALRSRMFQALDVQMAPHGFTSAQWPILRAVAHGTPTAAELCRQLNYDTGSMTRMLNRLEQKGVIKRVPSRNDLRVVELQITPAGRKVYPKLRSIVITVLNTMVTGLAPTDIERAHGVLKHMLSNLPTQAD